MGPSDISDRLLPWFEQHGRKHLPWQQQRCGYRVWLSEIMLQQTRVSTVIPYFERFVEAFPTVTDLADADLDTVLQYWAGLGYYARARNLHKAAQQLRDHHHGEFPSALESLMALPGVGRSTAGAILSLAFRKPATILDGNVKRVLARLYQVDGWPGQTATMNQLWHIAEQQTPAQQVDAYNQAMMDLGSLVCTRTKPDCPACPLNDICLSYKEGTQQEFPRPKPRKSRPQRHCWMLLHKLDNRLLLERRPAQGIWGGLWSLPELQDVNELGDWQLRKMGKSFSEVSLHHKVLQHNFSHFDLDISLALVDLSNRHVDTSVSAIHDEDDLSWIEQDALDCYGLPAPVSRLLSEVLDASGEVSFAWNP